MQIRGLGMELISRTVQFLASTNVGQFFIKKFDSILWTIEKPAKYCVNGDSRDDNQELPWLVFWAILIYLQIFRVVGSKILVKFDKNPIEPIDIVRKVQTWRRALRSIRFKGLRNIRKQRIGNRKSHETSVSSTSSITSSPRKQSISKRSHDEMLDALEDVFEDELEYSYQLDHLGYDTDDDTKSTLMKCKTEEDLPGSSSNEEYHWEDNHSPLNSKNHVPLSLADTLPIESTSEIEHYAENVFSESNDMNFGSTITDTDILEPTDRNSGSPNDKIHLKLDTNDKLAIRSKSESASAESTQIIDNSLQTTLYSTKSEPELSEPENCTHSKETLNQPCDPADLLMAQLLEKVGLPKSRLNGKHQQGNKKNSRGRNHWK